jgi:hypothetical protein
METKRLVRAIPWTEQEDACIKEVALRQPKASRDVLRELFKKHHPNTEHTDGAIEGRFSMVAPKYASRKWTPERCEKLVVMKQAGMTDKQIAISFNKEGLKITSVGIASQCAALRCRGMLEGSGQIKKAYSREIDGARQTKMDLTDTMQIPPETKCLKTSAPAIIAEVRYDDNELKGREIVSRMSNLTGEQMHLAHRFFDSLDKILK